MTNIPLMEAMISQSMRFSWSVRKTNATKYEINSSCSHGTCTSDNFVVFVPKRTQSQTSTSRQDPTRAQKPKFYLTSEQPKPNPDAGGTAGRAVVQGATRAEFIGARASVNFRDSDYSDSDEPSFGSHCRHEYCPSRLKVRGNAINF